MMSYSADLYIMLPCIRHKEYHSPVASCAEAEMFIRELSEVAKYEFDNVIGNKIERQILREITLVCKSDDRDSPEFMGNQKAFIMVSQYANTDFCLLVIVIIDIQVSLTHILDQVSRGELPLYENDKEIFISDWINSIGFESTGTAYFASCMSDFPDKEAPYVISGEAFKKDSDYYIRSSGVDALLNNNHAQYSHYDAYMSERGVLYVIKDFGDRYSDRINTECILIFILELVILKITAINIANNEVMSAFSDRNVSIDEIKSISEKFALSLPMWDMRHFRYFLAQEFADRVETSFNVGRHAADFERNRSQLEQIVNIRNLVVSDKDAKSFNVFATVLAIIEIFPILFSLGFYLLSGENIQLLHVVAFSLSSLAISATVWLIHLIKKRKK